MLSALLRLNGQRPMLSSRWLLLSMTASKLAGTHISVK